MIPPVYQVLTAVPAIVAIVGDRIFGSGVATQDKSRPYIVWQIVSANPDNNLSDTPEQDAQRVQVDVYSISEQICRQLETLVRDALEAQMHIVYGPWNDYEVETKLYRWSQDVSWLLDR